jgi:cytosine/adenosine deaminase-related metal-dependent hydrolase
VAYNKFQAWGRLRPQPIPRFGTKIVSLFPKTKFQIHLRRDRNRCAGHENPFADWLLRNLFLGRAHTLIVLLFFNRVHGDRSYDMPPLRMIQDSSIKWGFHTDATEVNQHKPFTTLWFAVTGKMLGGRVVNHQTITREKALIAHTRSNSYFVMRENDLGSIQLGKLADLVVMDRDYLTVPADQINEIKPVMTMIGGKVAYDAAASARGTR